MSTYSTESVTLYGIWEEIDQSEGRSGRRNLGYALTRIEAQEHAKGKGVQGTPTFVTEHRATSFTDGDDPTDVSYVLDENFIRQAHLLTVSPETLAAAVSAAKAKLSKYELEILGLA